MVFRFLVFHAELVPGVARQLARGEVSFQEAARNADDDERLGRRIAVAARPKRIDAADGPRQAVAVAVEIDGARLAVVPREDAEVRAVFGGEFIADLRGGLRELLPA